MSNTESVVEFGFLPFDHFLIALWDPGSPLSKQEQKRVLVDKWVRLGRYGRNSYMLPDVPYPNEIPDHVPQDLLSNAERAIDGQMPRVLLIRTWFGVEGDQASQDRANTTYARLKIYMFRDGDTPLSPFLGEECVFENKDEFSFISPSEMNDGIAQGSPGSVPSYVVTAFMHYPDMLDGLYHHDDDWRHYSPTQITEVEDEEDKDQCVLAVISDRKACEEGWVLCLAINHKGMVLPFRLRVRENLVGTVVSNWMEGQGLDENTLDPDQDLELYIGES